MFQTLLRNCFRNSSVRSWYSTKIGVVGAPFDKGQRKAGAALAPAAFRESGLVSHLQNLGYDVLDHGDIEYQPDEDDHIIDGAIHMKNVIRFNNLLSQKVCNIIKDGRMCLTLGGDHSIGVGTVHGVLSANQNTSVLWIDAHADLNTPMTSRTGNVHGMPVSFCLTELLEHQSQVPEFEWHQPTLSARHIAFIGLRDVDPYERLIIEKLDICAISMEELHHIGVNEALRYALSRIDPDNNRHLHVSFDIDALDPLEAPSTGTPVRGGLTLREGTQLVRTVQRTGRLSALDIVEVNTLLGSSTDAHTTLEAARHIAAAAAGYYSGGIAPVHINEIPKPRNR